MHADERQLTGRLGIGIGHARGIAFMPRGNEFDSRLDESVRNLEIGGAEQSETAARAERRKILCQDFRDSGIVTQSAPTALFDSLTYS